MVDEVEVFDVSDTLERAGKTAVEVFVTAAPAGFIFTDAAAAVVLAKSAGLSAGAAGAAVILNVVLAWSKSRKSRVQL